jgi:hypothetical protein
MIDTSQKRRPNATTSVELAPLQRAEPVIRPLESLTTMELLHNISNIFTCFNVFEGEWITENQQRLADNLVLNLEELRHREWMPRIVDTFEEMFVLYLSEALEDN